MIHSNKHNYIPVRRRINRRGRSLCRPPAPPPTYIGWVVALFTGHCHLKGHLFKLGLTDDPTCERCLEKDKSATHILCDCEAIVYLRFRHLGQLFMEPSDYYDGPINKVLHFIRSRIDKGLNKKGGSTIDHWRSRCKGRIIMAHPLCIHSFVPSLDTSKPTIPVTNRE
jgi:hypothetical protein